MGVDREGRQTVTSVVLTRLSVLLPSAPILGETGFEVAESNAV
jgi:hypothetical protein